MREAFLSLSRARQDNEHQRKWLTEFYRVFPPPILTRLLVSLRRQPEGKGSACLKQPVSRCAILLEALLHQFGVLTHRRRDFEVFGGLE
jgi:hypothetical protein